LSYGQTPGQPPNLRVVPPRHLDWIVQLPLLHVDQCRVFVHAAVHPVRPLDQQDPSILLWKRYPDDFDAGCGGRHIVHGHQAVAKGPMVMKHRTNLDTMAWKTGRLVIGFFEDNQPWRRPRISGGFGPSNLVHPDAIRDPVCKPP
jgi:serine/threonine protein phosphatase 1